MEAVTLPIYNVEGKEVSTLKLDSHVFDGTINEHAVYQEVNAYMANQRKGLAATKTRGEVSGGGRKPWKQKGTGRARVGSTRSPLWRHGGVIFGPHPRDFSTRLPQKIKLLALKSSLNAKVKDNCLIVLDQFKLESPKTKEAAGIIRNLFKNNKEQRHFKTLLLLGKLDLNLKKSLRNIGLTDYNLAQDTHAYEVLNHQKLIITEDGLRALTSRLKKK